MTNKEEEILKIITNYLKKNKVMPTFRFIQKKLNYKSVNSIYQYLKKLEKNGYLIRNDNGNLILNNNTLYNNKLRKIRIINLKNKYLEMALNKKNNYLAFKIPHNYFNKMNILKNDILIIQENKKLKNNDLGLFIIDNKPRIMLYHYKDGFYLLKDRELIILNKVQILGKVIILHRKI